MIVNDIILELKFDTADLVPSKFEVVDLYGKPYKEVDLYDFSNGYELTYRNPSVREYLSIPWDCEFSIESPSYRRLSRKGDKVCRMVGTAGPNGYGSAVTEIPQENMSTELRINFRAQPMLLLSNLIEDPEPTNEKLHEFANEIEFDYSMNWMFDVLKFCKVQFVNESK